MPQRPSARYCRGFTLTEIAIVLGIIGILLSAIWIAASNVYTSKKVQQATTQITQIVSGYRSLYGPQGVDVTTNTDVTCVGVNAGIYPPEMITSNTTTFCSTDTTNLPITPTTSAPQTPWGGVSYVGVLSQQAPPGVKIYYYNLSQSACNALADVITFAPNVIWENINGNPQWLAINANSQPPYSTATIQTFCRAGNTNNVAVMYKMK